MNKRHYLIYQITNTVNGKIYIGKHITKNIDDEYFGSGKYLKHAQQKYGLDKFIKIILFELQNKEEMDLLEKCVVTEDFCARSDTYNIKVGGEGGWTYVNKNPNNHGYSAWRRNKTEQENMLIQLKAQISRRERIKKMTDEEYQSYCQKNSQHIKDWHAQHPGFAAGENNPMYKHVYTDESRKKMSISHLGFKNSQYGKMWICNDKTHESKTIFKSEAIPGGWRRGRFCK